ncbi:nucleoprotein TPR isoform X2 [Diorhabda sublineata]|uniref:nucleoprotein TPR isoform X2 n=1 Tax=Diorhabda sublineata TaxID=1163346 RepID=UPI0024E185DF|nr:nucleoprotein TPR isoform X2 [Diorhabda sublineata]
MEDSFVFASVLSEDEWQSVPEEVGKKIIKFVSDNVDSLIKSKALLETKCYNLEKNLSDGELEVERSKLECQSLKAKVDLAANTIKEHENRLSNLTEEVNKLHTHCNTLEAEASEYRHQRNQAVDEKDEHLRMINRRNAEIERLQTDLNALAKQLETAVNAKCEALAQIDEVASLKLNIEYREKRIEQERVLLSSQVESLTQEVNKRTEELLDMRRDNTSLCIQLETKLSQKTQELTVATEQIKSLTDLNTDLTNKIDELSQKMINQRELDTKMNESYVYEIEAKTKMANAYKNMYEEGQQHTDELKEALSEVQQLLKTATDQYGQLETKYKESELANEEIILKKNEYIELLKKELESANEILENSKNGLDGDGMLSPNASISKMSKVGMSYSELYSRYVTVSDKLANKEEECARLENYIETIIKEMEGNFPKLRKLHEEYSESLNAIDSLKESNEQLLNEVQQLRDANTNCKKAEGIQSRENERLKKEVSDLSRQVVVLLQEIENSRVGSSSTSTDNDLSDSVNSADIISKKLVTFNDITELQANNLKLLVLVRELSERQEEVENLDPAAIAALKTKLDDLAQSHNELLEEHDKQIKMMATLRNQKDMYKNLYMQVVKTTGEEINVMDTSETGDIKIRTGTEVQLEEKVKEYEAQVDKLTKQVDHLREENETYRKEKTANEKILLEQLDNMRAEVKEITRLNCKLSSHADLNEEKFKILNNNIEIYKKQITALEKQNKIYSESIIKHEQAATYLKNETLQSQTKLSRAEVMLGNLEKENALLKDAEQRLLKERESLKRNSHEQHLIKSNIELIKATLERTDAESKLRLESRLDEAHRECAALRRRLQEEQDHFRELAEQLTTSNKNIQKRMEEEKEIAEKYRKEVAEVREELKLKVSQNEELSKKLKSGMFTVPDSSAETRKVRELEQQIADLQAEIESLKKKLKTAKDASEEYFNIAEASEKQAKEAVDNNELLTQEIDKHKSRIKELEEKCAELEGELSIQLDDQDISNANIKSKSTQLQEELNIRNMDLKTAKEQLENARSENKQLIEQLKAAENKYAREVTLHSVDLEALTNMKEQLNKTLDDLNVTQVEKQNAIVALDQSKVDWERREELFKKEKQELETRFADMDSQNSLLHDQIQALNIQLVTLQSLVTEPQNVSMGDSSFSKSFTEDEVKSSEQLLKIIKYLRQEKDIAVSKADIVEAEHSRLKSQLEMLNKELEDAKITIESERQKTEISVISAAKHAEVLRKLETLNAITDSNRTLRQERDTLVAQITELRIKSDRFETEVEPLQEKNRELTTKADQLQSENISLRAECTRWRQRANMLIEKTNRTSPEDWKKLQTERETLAKQLTIERANVTRMNEEINNLKQDKSKLEEQLKNMKIQNNQHQEEIARLREDVSNLQAQVTQLTSTVDQQSAEIIKFREENRVLTEDTAGKDVTISDLKNNLAQIRKIAKKYKIQYEEQSKELETVKQQNQQYKSEQSSNADKQAMLQNQCSELEEKVHQLEISHREQVENMNREITSTTDQIDHFKKEIENLKQTSQDKEERFKTLFKNAKERIVSLTEQNNNLKEEVRRQDSSSKSDGGEQSNQDSTKIAEYLEKISALERERDDILEEKQQEHEKHTTEVENLNQRILQLQRQLGLQQGSKPSTSSSTTEKSPTERPTADIKPMAGHSTNTQTQSVPIQPWRSGGEPPLASIRPMSAQLRTVAVLPTSQSPSAIIPPQQQVHTTGSSSIEALSSSPTSSHTEYVPATSSATPTMLGPRQVVVPPTQSSQDTEDDENSVSQQVQAAPQAQAVALVLPRVEPPSSGPTQEQGTSSSSSNTVTTTQAGHKRQREADMDSCQSDDPNKTQQQTKRTRVQAGTVSDSCLEVEYQVPTSSQRDHDDDNVIVVESDEEGGADEGEGADDEQDDPDTEGYDMEGMEQDNYGDADCQDVEDDEEEGGNEVEVIDDSSEVPNQSERSEQINEEEENSEQPQSEAISSGTDGSNTSSYNATISQVSTSVSMTVPSLSRTRPIPPLSSRQNHFLLQHGLEDIGDDGIVPSTPTLYVPRRSDGFGEAVSSPHVPTSGRFTFNDQTNAAGSNNVETVPEQTLMESNNLEEDSTGRSVPTTPLQSSPQEGIPGNEEQNTTQMAESGAEIPTINVSAEADNNETVGEGSSADMGPPADGAAQIEQNEAMLEGDDGVSSEGEKPPVTEEDEEEGREAEASPSTNSRGIVRGTNSARRSMRSSLPRGTQSRGSPIPIVWGDRSPQRHQHNQDRNRGSPSGNFQSRTVARRARGRNQRPFGGRF